jgi:protein phosphatase
VSWSSWWRNLWGGDAGPRPRPTDPSATIDLPGPPSGGGAGLPKAPGGAGDRDRPSRLLVGVVSTVGNHREHNEDNYFVPGRPSLHNGSRPKARGGFETTVDIPTTGRTPTADGVEETEPEPDANAPSWTSVPLGGSGLFIVADGMGGQLGGEVASQMAVELIPRELVNRLEPDADDRRTRDAIREAVAAANREVLALSHVNTEVTNLGTTVVLTLFRRDRAYVANFGDSRAYRLRDGKLEQLTKDHSLARALIDAGTIPPEEEERHRFRNVLYLYLGCNDARDGPEVHAVDVRVGDRFLLATDGLTGVVRNDQIAEILASGDDPQRAAEVLIEVALANGSKDNITAVVVHVT